MPARPGAEALSSVSSVRLTADSQPQYANTPSSSPPVRAPPPPANGFSHDSEGVTASSELSPDVARHSATPANTSSAATCARISTFCSLADISVPRTHNHVISRISATASTRTTRVFSASESRPRV